MSALLTPVLAIVVVLTFVWMVKSRGEHSPWVLWVLLAAVAALTARLVVLRLRAIPPARRSLAAFTLAVGNPPQPKPPRR